MSRQRFQALDVMRGLTLALMILVNTPGSWSHVYPPLLHADWHGATPTDFIFPFFLFMVGAAMVFSQKSFAAMSNGQRWLKIGRRTFLIFFIGVLLNYFPFNQNLNELRIPGVLQRIALAYFFAALIVHYVGLYWRWIIAAALLLGYWLLLQLSVDPYSLEHSVVRQLDIWILGENHIWRGKGIAFDPEGILSTLPSIVSVLIGFEITRHLIAATDKNKTLGQLLILGIALCVVGILWHSWFPINKYLWTSSFVLVTSGVGVLVLLLLVRLEGLRLTRGIYRGFTMLGQNPLFIYALSILWAKSLYLITINNVSAYEWGFQQLNRVANPMNASLLFAIFTVSLMWFIAWLLHRNRIIIAL